MAKKFLALDFSFRCCTFSKQEVVHFFGPWTTTQENGSSLLCDGISGFHSPTKQAVKDCKIEQFTLSSHSLRAMIVKRVFYHFRTHFVVTSKNNTRIRRSLKIESYVSLFHSRAKQAQTGRDFWM